MGEYLYHFSEDPTIEVFVPRVARTQQVEGSWVWAVDDYRAPTYWFPRDCPRATWWNADDSGHRVHAIQWDWLDAFLAVELFVYRLPAETFRRTEEVFGSEGRGFWVTPEAVMPADVAPVGPLLDKHREARIEFRVVSDLRSLWLDVIERPGLDFSGIRLGNLDTF